MGPLILIWLKTMLSIIWAYITENNNWYGVTLMVHFHYQILYFCIQYCSNNFPKSWFLVTYGSGEMLVDKTKEDITAV